MKKKIAHRCQTIFNLIKFFTTQIDVFHLIFGVFFIYYSAELNKSRKISTQSNGGHLESNLMSRQIDRIFGCTQLYWWCFVIYSPLVARIRTRETSQCMRVMCHPSVTSFEWVERDGNAFADRWRRWVDVAWFEIFVSTSPTGIWIETSSSMSLISLHSWILLREWKVKRSIFQNEFYSLVHKIIERNYKTGGKHHHRNLSIQFKW